MLQLLSDICDVSARISKRISRQLERPKLMLKKEFARFLANYTAKEITNKWELTGAGGGGRRRRRRGAVSRVRRRLGSVCDGRVAGRRRRRPRVVRRAERVQRVVEHVRVAAGVALLETATAKAAGHRAETETNENRHGISRLTAAADSTVLSAL